MQHSVSKIEPQVLATQLELPRPAPELSIVVPTFNERENIPRLVDMLKVALAGIPWELIVVDDNSPDGTSEIAKHIGSGDSRIRCIRRVGRRGLAGACLEGILASQAQYVAVMDGDLQHDESLLVPMIQLLRGDSANMVVATRYAGGGSAAALSSPRAWGSLMATRLARRVLKIELTDPMSGFFMLRRELVEKIAPRLSTQGFKVLLDIVVTAGSSLRIAELPFTFRRRVYGESKLDAAVTLEYLGLLLAKATDDAVSLRFTLFCLVGAFGIGVHFLALTVAYHLVGLEFVWAQTLAMMVAIASNFAINNALTYRDRRLRGLTFLGGLLRFYLVSMAGLVSNIGVSDWLFINSEKWWVAGLAGAVIGVVWNYVVASQFVWRSQ
ncbi:MAG TPA: glycosyltransferase family 2 protein [Xanthobacteraceae bacterium]|nr:glycosyltransferase family 2 protein [Xanthobacteraceae bacterium]